MPKKQKTRRSAAKAKFPFAHPTKHGKLHWKKVTLIVLAGTMGLLLAAAITAQAIYNRFVWDRLAENGSLRITLLIQNALEGLDNLKISPEQAADGSLLIKEMKLKLPAETADVRKLMYFYSPADSGSDDTGYSWNMPESVQITTKQLSDSSRQRLLVANSPLEVFEYVPEAQACNRGFLLQFQADSENGLTLSGQKQLKDGRTVYVYREPNCKYLGYSVDALEEFLLRAESY